MSIELWVFDLRGQPIHSAHEAYLTEVYSQIYGWDPDHRQRQLASEVDAAALLRAKSDLFWESLAQQVAERVFGETISPAFQRLGPACRTKTPACRSRPAAHRVVVKTWLDGATDLMTLVTRSITYIATRGAVSDPELIFELQVPNGLHVTGPTKAHPTCGLPSGAIKTR